MVMLMHSLRVVNRSLLVVHLAEVVYQARM